MAKFLQDAIEEMAVSKKIQSKDSAQSLVTFFQDVIVLTWYDSYKNTLYLYYFATTRKCVSLTFFC